MRNMPRAISFLMAILLTISLLPSVAIPANASDEVYYPLDFTEEVLASRIIQRVSGGCAVASMATIEAYMFGATTDADKEIVYNALISANGDDDYAYWGNVGYLTSQDSIDWEDVYNQLAQGMPCIIHRPASSAGSQHWSVVAGYRGSSTQLEPDKFLVVEVNEKSGEAIQTVAQWRGNTQVDRYTWRGSGLVLTGLPGIRFTGNHPPVIKEYGVSHRVYGRISSDSSVTDIEINIINLDRGEAVFSRTLRPNVGSYDLSALDSAMSFSTWAEGSYYYTVYAKSSRGEEIMHGYYFEIASQYPQEVPNPSYIFSFDANGASGTMNPVSVHLGDQLTLPACSFSRFDSPFGGWYLKRDDDTWYTTANLWLTEDEIAAEGYTKYLFQDGFSGIMDAWWIRDARSLPVYTYVAQWPEGQGNESVNAEIYRIYGNSRYETAFAIADVMKAELEVDGFDAIVIANGTGFADALAGSYLAAVNSAPILITNGTNSADLRSYIQRNLNSNGVVYILGGTAAVSADIESALKHDGIRVIRLAGDNRFDTNLEILKEAGASECHEILVATGYDFADSLSASATGMPILLVNNINGALTDSQTEFLKSLEDCTFTIIGGTSAVSTELENALSEYGEVNRIAGNNREATSVRVAENYFDSPTQVVLAYSRNFPDGLCGGPLAYVLGAPMILVNAGQEVAASAYVSVNQILSGRVLGGTAVVSDSTVRAVFSTGS